MPCPIPSRAGPVDLSCLRLGIIFPNGRDRSLKRLQTDRLDVVFVHALGELSDREREQSRLFDENMLAAVESMKKAAKVRFLACSSHGPHGLEPLLTQAIESGHFDFVMPAFNFMSYPKLPEIIKTAKAKGVGVVAMKTLAGAKAMELEASETPFEHAAFKWVLQHPEVAGLVVTFNNFNDLDRYASLFGADYCRTGCGDCDRACPHGLPVRSKLEAAHRNLTLA